MPNQLERRRDRVIDQLARLGPSRPTRPPTPRCRDPHASPDDPPICPDCHRPMVAFECGCEDATCPMNGHVWWECVRT